MAREARHFGVTVGAVIAADTEAKLEIARFRAIAADQLRPRGLGVEGGCGGVDRVPDEAHLPFEIGVDDRTLHQLAATICAFQPFEPALAIRV